MPIIGLDLGTHTIRAVEFEVNKRNIILSKFGSYENPRIKLTSDSREDLKLYSAALRDFFAEVGFSSSAVVTSIPESQVFTRVIKVPQMSEKELRSSIAFAAEQYIPLPLSEVDYDFEIIDSDLFEKDKMEVLLVAAKNSTTSKYVNLLKSSGLTPKGLEPETLAITRAITQDDQRPGASILLNIGSFDSQIIISYKGHVRFTRTVTVGGDTLTRAISQSLNLEYPQAEEYKKTYGLDRNQAEGKVYEALKPVFDNIIAEIKRSRIFYATRYPNVNISRIVLSGGTALMPGLLYYMVNNLDLEVELANTWRNIQFSPKIEHHKESLTNLGPMFVTCVGLALKEVER